MTGTESSQKRALRDMATLLLALRQENPENEEERELQAWFSKLSENFTTPNPFMSFKRHRENIDHATQKMWLLLRECLITQRWPEATNVMTGLVKEVKDSGQSIFKFGFEIFFNNPKGNKRFLEYFLGQITRQPDVDFKEAHLEYALYLISQNCIEEAKEQLKTAPEKKHKTRTYSKAGLVNVQFKAYQGLLCYMDWITAKSKIESLQDQASYGEGYATMELSGLIGIEEEKMKSAAENAINYFEILVDTAGNWDTFIPKYVQMLQHCGKSEECLSVLEGYVQKNPENPNGLKLLYKHHKDMESDAKILIDILQKFCRLVPSDKLCLELYRLYQQEEPGNLNTKALELLFDLLDYGVWQYEYEPFDLLAEHLHEVHKRGIDDNIRALTKCWTLRKSWWPSYHFRSKSVKCQRTNRRVLVAKACLAALLLGPDNEYSTVVTSTDEYLSEDELNLYQRYIDDYNVVVRDAIK